MRPALGDLPAVDDEDLVRRPDRGQPVGDHQRRPPGQRRLKRPLDGQLGFGVQVRGGLVQHDHRRGLEQQPGQGQALFLPAGEAVAAVPHNRVQPVRQRRDQRPDPGRLARLDQLLFGRRRSRVPQVDPDRVVQHVRVLRHDTDHRPQRLQRQVADVVPADPHRPAHRVIQPRHQVRDRRLPRPRRADQRGQLPGRHCEGDVPQHPRLAGTFRRGQRDRLQGGQRHLTRLGIPEPHSRKLHPRRPVRMRQRISRRPFGDQRFQVEDLEDAVKADQRGEDFQRQVGHFAERLVQLRDQHDERHQRADRESTVNDQSAAEPVDERGDQRREQRDVGADQLHAGHVGDGQITDPGRLAGEQLGVLRRPSVQLGQQRARYIGPFGGHRSQLAMQLHLLPEQPLPSPPGHLAGQHEQRDHR